MSKYIDFINEEVSSINSLGKLIISSQLFNKHDITITRKGDYILYKVDGEPFLEIKDYKNKTQLNKLKPNEEISI